MILKLMVMTGGMEMLLLDFGSLMRIDVLVWIVGVPIAIALVIFLVYQFREYRQLKSELAQLAKIKRYNIEYELVLKAMKLSIWRVDTATATINIESDYREKSDSFSMSPGSSLEVVYNQIVEGDRQRVKDALEDVLAGRAEDFHQQYQMRVANSSETYWEETFATIDKRDVDGRPLTVVGTSMCIDDRKEIEHALIEARNHAEESDRLKSAFLANITHEVRTPLNAIVGFSDVLPMVQSDEERNELIKLIKQNNAHLLRLFDDMMNISKLEAGNGGEIVKVDFEILPMLRELADKYMTVAMEKNVQVLIDENVADEMIHTDRDRLKEILNQYMNNAVKFTDSGNISIGYTKHPTFVRLWVRDTGKGIPADKCNDRLFERFVKVDDFVAGTGLGLSICRSLAKALDGIVGVESVFGKGSTFWVDIPL